MSLRAVAISACLAFPGLGVAMETSAGKVTVTKVAGALKQPWAIGHLPDGGILITERAGKIVHLMADGTRLDLGGVPRVVNKGQGGLLDVMIPRDFSKSRQVYLSYASVKDGVPGTALGVGKLSADGTQLKGFKKLWQMATPSNAAKHFGSRIVEAKDGTLFLTIGDRGDRPEAQNLRNHNGAIVRITRTGTPPTDNPWAGRAGAEPEIYSYGHRNPQGAALDLNGNLWIAEHGAKGGDEVNKIKPGANYGWPVISYGRHYSGFKIGEGTSKQGMEQPEHYWDPSMAPSGMMIYSGKLWPEWKGDIFVGSLKFDYISRLDGAPLTEVEQLKSKQTARVRDVVEGPDGAIWFLSVDSDALYRITP